MQRAGGSSQYSCTRTKQEAGAGIPLSGKALALVRNALGYGPVRDCGEVCGGVA